MNEQSIFIEALDMHDPAERAAFLDQACAGDAALRGRLDRLLERHQEADSFLQAPATDAPLAGERPATRIGPYKLLEQLGEGGFGLVFLAEQQQPVRRLVALKILKPGMDTRQVIARFEHERQALALMDHPHIAKVLDAGSTESGRPYFVMELVKGIPITQYCDQERLTVRERLALFIPVCQAVQHAHQKGIIHRDLKPSNVLIALYDGEPVAKVIDFGVAKAVSQKLTERTLYTGPGQVIGTLEYMAPEQAELNNLDIDTRADIYSLGVLLYELLTGSPPFTAQQLRSAAFTDMLRLIREVEPAKPSTKLSSSKELPAIAQRRKLEPKTLTRQVQGDLDWIVMKCLEKERARRYETANGLAMDLERYLRDEAVLAGAPGALYRLKKLARRNRTAIVAAGLVALALAVGLVLSTCQAIRATRAEHLAQTRLEAEGRARQEAQANFQMARAVVDDMYTQVAEKWLANQPHMASVQREFLEKALRFYEKVAQERGTDPSLRVDTARAYHRVGLIHESLESQAPAETAYREAVREWTALADEFADTPEYRQNLAKALVDLGRLVQNTGRLAEAETVMSRGIAILEKLAADFPAVQVYRRDLGQSCIHWADLLIDLGRREVSRKAHGSALAIQRQLVAESPLDPENRRDLAETLSLWGFFKFTTIGQRRESVAIMEKLVAEFPQQPRYALQLASSYFFLGRSAAPAEGVPILQKAVALQRKLVEDFPTAMRQRDQLARILGGEGLGGMLARAGRTEEALKAVQESIAIGEKLVAASPTVTYHRQRLSGNYSGLANLLRTHGRFEEAAKEYRKAFELGQKSPRAYYGLAIVLEQMGRHEEAAKEFQHLLDLNPNTSGDCNNIAWFMATFPNPKLRDSAKAVALAKKAVELEPKNEMYWNTLGAAHYRAGASKEAILALTKSMELRKGGDSFDWFFLAMSHWQLGNQDEARRWHGQAVAWMDQHRPKDEELLRFRAEAAELLGVKDVTKPKVLPGDKPAGETVPPPAGSPNKSADK